MGYYSGSSGTIKYAYASNPKAESSWVDTQTKVTNWTMTTSAQLLDTTTLGNYDKTSVYGLRTTSGTLKLFYYRASGTQSNTETNSGSWFINILERGDPAASPEVRLRLYVDDKNNTSDLTVTDYVELNANLTSVSYGSNVGELVAVDVSFEATGPVTDFRL